MVGRPPTTATPGRKTRPKLPLLALVCSHSSHGLEKPVDVPVDPPIDLPSADDSVVVDPDLTVAGSLGATLVGYDASGITPRREPISWTFDGAFNVDVGGIDIPFDFIFSEQERDFRQPFNRFGASPSLGPVSLHLGYRSMPMSRYTLAEASFFGAGLSIRPGPFVIEGMYGRFRRAISPETIDTAEIVIPSFERWGYAGKVGIETETAEIGLVYFHAIDDSTSIDLPRTEIVPLRPEENTALGLLLGFDIIAGTLRFEADAGASILTRDIGSSESDTTDIPGVVSSLQTIRNATTLTLASRAELAYTDETFGLTLGYERVEPEYASHGAYYFTTDVERFTLAPSLVLQEGRIRLAGAIGLEHDNLLDTRAAQTDRIVGSANVGWDVTDAFGFEASYLNFSSGQSAGREPINDSIAFRSVSQSASLAPRLFLTGKTMNHFITLLASLQEYTDLSAITNLASDVRSLTGNLLYSLSFADSPLTLGASTLYGQTTSGDIETRSIGGTLNAGLSLGSGRLGINGSVGLTQTMQDIPLLGETSATALNESLMASYRVGSSGSLFLRGYATQSSGDLSLGSDFDEITAELGYRHRFNYSSESAAEEGTE